MTDEDIEKIIKRNMNLQMNLAGIRADFEEASQRQWVGLTLEQKHQLNDALNLQGRFAVIDAIEAKLKESNA